LNKVEILDKELIKRRFEKAMDGYSAHAGVQRRMAERLVGMLFDTAVRSDAAGSGCNASGVSASGFGHRFRSVLEIGCGDGLLTGMFAEKFSPEKMIVNDLCPSAEKFLSGLPVAEFVPGDAEQIDFGGHYDLVLSGAAVQWFNDLPAFFEKCAKLLKSKGMLAFSTFGPDNLKEFAALEDVGLKYYGADELEDMLSGHFAEISVVQEHILVTFGSPAEVLRHLKSTGVTGVRREAWTKGKYSVFVRRYEELFGCPGGVTLTWHPIWVLAGK